MTAPRAIAAGCDTHVHVIGDRMRYPMSAQRQYTPPEASVSDLRAHLQRMGLQRAVIVQPSVYALDNRCLLDALAHMQGHARGIAVLPDNVSVGELRELDAQGVRGIRLNLESVSNHDPVVLRQALQHWGAHLADVGWHVQVYAPTGLIAACADTIRHLPVPCVLDHFALWSHVDCEDTDSQTVLQLLQEGHVYIKLSGSYRVSLGTEALQTLARRLIQTNVHRLLWASDWPHTNRAPGVCALDESPYRDIDPSGLLQQRNHLLGTPEVIHQVLIDNAAHLYRF